MMHHYEDDSHFCLKCRTTIIGLDNYVAHRKSDCAKFDKSDKFDKSIIPIELMPQDESFTLNADDFFMSLELQSSAKKQSASGPSANSGKLLTSGIRTRSKTTAAIQSTSKEEPAKSGGGKNAWIGGHQLKELGSGDNQSKLLKAVDNLSRHNTIKKDERPQQQLQQDSEDSDEDSNDYDSEDDEYDYEDGTYPPKSHTGGKWKPCSPIHWGSSPSTSGAKWKPKESSNISPPHHTKGKWKPSPQHHSSGKVIYDNIPPPTFTGSKWTPTKAKLYEEGPSSSYTRGKWKPPNKSMDKRDSDDEDEEYSLEIAAKRKKPPSPVEKQREIISPTYTKGKWLPQNSSDKADSPIEKQRDIISPTYTKGKWLPPSINEGYTKQEIPPFRKYGSSVQYWCSPCNRRLASKVVYDRHLNSDLHRKRAIQDFDDDSKLSVPIKQQKNLSRQAKMVKSMSENPDKKTRRKIYTKCTVCCSKVYSHQMGKHLISHYHCRRGNINTMEAHNLVLENIYDIVIQSPFQCAPCSFYCNTFTNFLQHWVSEVHDQLVNKLPGYFVCSFCTTKCENTHDMYYHLVSEEHKEVISAINRSFPIIIKKINPVQCLSCEQEFLYNFELIKHCQRESHFYDDSKYNLNQFRCNCCNESQKSKIALQRHIKKMHNQKMYFCSTCLLDFNTKEEATIHRNSIGHKNKVHKTESTYKCKHCLETFKDLNKYRNHLLQNHPENTYSCPNCGKGFILSQDVSSHVKSKLCLFSHEKKTHVCKTCPFSTDSLSEFIFHKILHTESVYRERDDGSLKQTKHYKCPLCGKFFVKATMRSHISTHTNERPHACNKCAAAFVRRSSLVQHQREKHKEQGASQLDDKVVVERKYLCSMCGARFKKKSILKNHMLLHTGKMFSCSEPNCVVVSRTQVELEDHIETTHSDEKNFHCVMCDYKGKTKRQLMRHMTVHGNAKTFQCPQCEFSARVSSNLKRHMRVHDIGKTYGCPYCTYRCKNLDNIRKHIMLTKKHPNKSMYECKFCHSTNIKPNQNHSHIFRTNHVKDFQVHLVVKHSDCFANGAQALNYICSLYELKEGADFNDYLAMDAGDVSVNDGRSDRESGGVEEEEEVVDGMLLGLNCAGDGIEASHNPQEELLFTEYVVNTGNMTPTESTATDSWTMVTSYEVEGAGNLVPFHPGESLFHEHFS